MEDIEQQKVLQEGDRTDMKGEKTRGEKYLIGEQKQWEIRQPCYNDNLEDMKAFCELQWTV